jgi:pyruvate formate lyase activating enzyme
MGLKVLNIQKFCQHDGPGIRTTVFLKGCPLRCWWCHNPESIEAEIELVVDPEKCVNCGRCQEICTHEECVLCGTCVEACLSQARMLMGQDMTVDEIMLEIMKDKAFYETSGGGVTISGGDPLLQSEELIELLVRLKTAGIHVALDTSGYSNWNKLNKLIDQIDLFLFDLKVVNQRKHLKYTGADNEIIIENLQRLSDNNQLIWIRIPLIEGINTDEKDIDEFIGILKNIRFEQINLLPYHAYGTDKFRKFAIEETEWNPKSPGNEQIKLIKGCLTNAGFRVIVGG